MTAKIQFKIFTTPAHQFSLISAKFEALAKHWLFEP